MKQHIIACIIFVFVLASCATDKPDATFTVGDPTPTTRPRLLPNLTPPDGQVVGQVFRPDGTAFEGATIAVNPIDGSSESNIAKGYMTDRQGNFQTDALPPSKYRLNVNGSPDPSWSQDIEVQSGQTTRVVFHLIKLTTIGCVC